VLQKRQRVSGTIINLGLALAACILLGIAGLTIYAKHKLSKLVLGGLGEAFSTKVYGGPFLVKSSTPISPEHLIKRLERLRYTKVDSPPTEPGQYQWEPLAPRSQSSGGQQARQRRAPLLALNLYLRGFNSPQMAEPSRLIRLQEFQNLWSSKDEAGNEIDQIALEPELIAELSGPKRIRREPATWREIPENLKHAVVAVEDKRFFSHWGIDPHAIARAIWFNITKTNGLQGASTITQQLAKNMLLSPKRTLRRKMMEAVLAVYLEIRYSKEEILTLYLNHIYFGQDGPVSIAGVKAAARFYFSKNLKDLNLNECAILAGLIRSPHRYNPLRDVAASLDRRNFVLRHMFEESMITREELKNTAIQTIAAKPHREGLQKQDVNAYFVSETVRQMLNKYSEEELFRYGLSIYTTEDPLLQKFAQESLKSSRAQAALIAIDPQSGDVLALAGGKNYQESQFNRATQALRQPGSAFKPFVFGAALEKGFTPATLLLDQPKSYSKNDPLTLPSPPRGEGIKSGRWEPKNFDNIYFGTTTLRNALAHSLNSATLDLAQKVGTDKILAFAKKLGIESPLENSLATVLGASEVTLLELVSAYAPFANGGFRVKTHLITSVTDAQGNTIEFAGFERSQVIDPALAYLMTSLMQSVIEEGTARSLAKLGWNLPSAGKTGTTNDGRDAWFIGYTPNLLTGVWVGEDNHRAINATGAKNAVPLWAAFMKSALANYPATKFAQPQGLTSVKIDPLSGLRARTGCPERKKELFLAGTEPKLACPLHQGGVKGWFRHILGLNTKRDGN